MFPASVTGSPARSRAPIALAICGVAPAPGHRQAKLAVHVANQPAGKLQLGHVHVQVHPVDALDLEHHVLR